MNWYLEVLKKYAVFSGRARRKEYWFFVLFNAIIAIVLSVIDVLVGTYNPVTQTGVLNTVYSVGVFIPSIAVTVRRLHDTDRSGWWIMLPTGVAIGGAVVLAILMPSFGGEYNSEGPSQAELVFIGLYVIALFASVITLFVFMVMDGTPGPNRFGEDPKQQIIPQQNNNHSPYKAEEKTVQQSSMQPVVITGEGGLGSIKIYPGRKITVGRSQSADVHIDNKFVSSKHVSLHLNDNGTVTVTDLGSSNGTYIQGKKLDSHIPYVLHPGDRIVLGSEDVVYKYSG